MTVVQQKAELINYLFTLYNIKDKEKPKEKD